MQIESNSNIKINELTNILNKSTHTIENYITKIKKFDYIERKGSKLGGSWEIKQYSSILGMASQEFKINYKNKKKWQELIKSRTKE